MPDWKQRRLRRIAALSAVPMFGLALAYLLCIAVLVVVWVDVPTLSESSAANGSSAVGMPGAPAASIPTASAPGLLPESLTTLVLISIAVIWPLVILESLFHVATRPWTSATARHHAASLLICLCPPLRMYARSPELGNRLWLPILGWRKGDRALQCRLQRFFSVPMIVIALMILPVLITEYFLKAQVAQYVWLQMLLHVSTGLIWFAFAAEFILMVSVAEKKWAYVRANWVDLAIILLPVVSFLRTLRIIRVTRLAQIARAQQLTKMARVYRLRGTAMKAFRALIVLELVHRITGSDPQRRLRRLRDELLEKQHEVARLQREITKLERHCTDDSAGPARAPDRPAPSLSPSAESSG